MYVHGASSFDVVATPTRKQSPDGDSLVYMYDGLATFEQDGEKHEYSLVDGTAYYTNHPVGRNASKSGCLPAGFVPPIETLLSAIDTASTATHLVANDMAEVVCPRGSLMAFTFAGENYLLCMPQHHHGGFQIFGEDLDIDFRYEDSVPVIEAPSIPADVEAYCGKVPFNGAIAPSGYTGLASTYEAVYILAGEVIPHKSTENDGLIEFDSCSYGLDTPTFSSTYTSANYLTKLNHQDCTFRNGDGLFSDAKKPMKWLKNLLSHRILRNLQQQPAIRLSFQLKRKAMYVHGASSFDVLAVPYWKESAQGDMFAFDGVATFDHDGATHEYLLTGQNVYYTHRTGGDEDPRHEEGFKIIGEDLDVDVKYEQSSPVVMAPRIPIDPSTTWVAVGGPFMGSMGSNFMQDACDGEPETAAESLYAFFGECPVNTGVLSMTYENENYSTDALNQAYADAQAVYGEGVDAVLCSDSYSGVWSLDKVLYEVMGRVLPHKSLKNDAKHYILRNLQQQPALRLTFQIKRKAMYVHGASTFDVVATPAPRSSPTDNSVVYNGLASFEKDGDTHEYSLVDGTAFYTRHPGGKNTAVKPESSCLPSQSVPPIGTVLNAIHNAQTAPQPVGSSDSRCPGGSVMAFPFAGENFVLCSQHSGMMSSLSNLLGLSSSADAGFKIFGSDLNIHVKYEPSTPVISAPRIDPEMVASCGKVPSPAMIIPSVSSLVTRSFSEWGHRTLRAEGIFSDAWDLITDSSCACKGAQRTCVFVAGLSSYDDYGLTDNDPEGYFGEEIGDHAPCCSSIKYITLATKNNFWNDPAFQQRFVDLLVQASGTSDVATGTIKDTIVIAHSMGNLILSGAIAGGKCNLDPSSSWIATSSPMEGSMGSNYVQGSCDGSLSGAVALLMELLGDCPATTGEVSLAYQNSNYSSVALNDAYIAAQAAYAANVDAAMCSNSYSGLVTVKAALYALAGGVLPHKSPENDGIVEYGSCAFGLNLDQFDSTYESHYYRSELNHVDMSFRNGDGVFGDAKKPMKWFECLL
ncbi:hypothetical protein JM18_001531 [Phytophthora kernoviae]|uniref:Uncharacterized protein n=2 Tax=Phytophthora kernoviae TaxID=325452 RepID=A0A922ASE3_9STRA|nr:hypothetical protein G195_002241 [Phytophthora kernoviae 00238/432]KAG2531896.1 hypothetical protein JM18_001531 [Phytophthora kernoviae]